MTVQIAAGVATLIAAYVVASLRIAAQYERAVIFRLGRYSRTSGPGVYLVWAFVEWQRKLDLRTVTAIVEQQEGITRGNVPSPSAKRILEPSRCMTSW